VITIVKPCTSPAFGGHCRVCTGANLDLTGLSFVESALSILYSTAALLHCCHLHRGRTHLTIAHKNDGHSTSSSTRLEPAICYIGSHFSPYPMTACQGHSGNFSTTIVAQITCYSHLYQHQASNMNLDWRNKQGIEGCYEGGCISYPLIHTPTIALILAAE